MYVCTYTKDKQKKRKKWIDGFIVKNDKRITLYNEEKVSIYSTVSYKVQDDDIIDTQMYLIETSFLESLMNNIEAPADEFKNEIFQNKNKFIYNASPVHVAPYKNNYIEEEIISVNNLSKSEKLEGRTKEDILNLFKK